MSRKFVILSNGLRDQGGHYFETSISLAEAARREGWRPVLATHVDCAASLLPDWLESYPLFCTDHWMAGPPAEPPDLTGVCANPYSRRRVSAAAIRRGQATLREFLASRFDGFKTEDGLPRPSHLPLDGLGRPSSAVFHRYRTTFERAVRLTDRLAYCFLPPVLYLALKKIVAWTVPPILLPEVQAKLTAKLSAKLSRAPSAPVPSVIDFGPCGPHTAQALKDPAQRDFVGEALIKLRACNMAHEVEFAMIFKRDLERFLALADIGADDHVLLGTAHPRELLAIGLVCRQLGVDRSPAFHLEFRHPLFRSPPNKGTGTVCRNAGESDEVESPYLTLHRVFFSLYEKPGPLPNIQFSTDTEELARDFGRLSEQPFEVLPIPFRGELIAPAPSHADGPLRLAFVGEARDEKGFAWLPDLIEDLTSDYVNTGKVRFIVQANLGDPRYNPQSLTALERLKHFPPEVVELFGLDGPLSPAEYYRLVSESHVVLVPYDRERYRATSSGTLAEAVAGGRPVVVPTGTWMAAQLPYAAGEAFDDYTSLVAAVRRVVDDYAAYAARAEACRAAWLTRHSPDALIRAVAGHNDEARIAA